MAALVCLFCVSQSCFFYTGVQSAPESIGESASRADSYSGAPAGAQVNIPATQDVNFFDPEQHLLVLVLDHSKYENAQAQAAGVQQGEDDSKVLADFWGTGFVDREMDVEIVAKLAEVRMKNSFGNCECALA